MSNILIYFLLKKYVFCYLIVLITAKFEFQYFYLKFNRLETIKAEMMRRLLLNIEKHKILRIISKEERKNALLNETIKIIIFQYKTEYEEGR